MRSYAGEEYDVCIEPRCLWRPGRQPSLVQRGTTDSAMPTEQPTVEPTVEPTVDPTQTDEPTAEPTEEPTAVPTAPPTQGPTACCRPKRKYMVAHCPVTTRPSAQLPPGLVKGPHSGPKVVGLQMYPSRAA